MNELSDLSYIIEDDNSIICKFRYKKKLAFLEYKATLELLDDVPVLEQILKYECIKYGKKHLETTSPK